MLAKAIAVARAFVRRGQAWQPQQRLEAREAFEAVVAAIPVVGERERQAQRPIGVVRADQMIERGAMIVVLALAARQPRPRAAPVLSGPSPSSASTMQ